ncbi:MAG: glycosyltransferase, partial [Candidatus Goldbacteria bacterium]|nr:glycosyltransferase [Candidatus Goldiibacteriota bacterium]
LSKKGINVVLMDNLVHPINLFYDTIALFELRDYFIKNKIDIVHTHSSKAGILGRKAAYLAGVKKIIHTVHGFSFHEYQNFIIHYLFLFLEKIFSFITSKLIAVGYDVMEYGLKKGVGNKDKYEIIKPGIDMQLFKNAKVNKKEYLRKYGLRPDFFTIGMIGNLKKQKNPMEFIEIAKLVIRETDDTQFIFAGSGKNINNIKKILQKNNIQNRVKFIGWIDAPEKFLKSIDLFLLTSLWEGLPCVLVQAICSGCYCVATDVCGNREFMQDVKLEKYLYKPGYYKKAKEFILKIKKYGQERPKMEKLYEYDYKYMLKKYNKIYFSDV